MSVNLGAFMEGCFRGRFQGGGWYSRGAQGYICEQNTGPQAALKY